MCTACIPRGHPGKPTSPRNGVRPRLEHRPGAEARGGWGGGGVSSRRGAGVGLGWGVGSGRVRERPSRQRVSLPGDAVSLSRPLRETRSRPTAPLHGRARVQRGRCGSGRHWACRSLNVTAHASPRQRGLSRAAAAGRTPGGADGRGPGLLARPRRAHPRTPSNTRGSSSPAAPPPPPVRPPRSFGKAGGAGRMRGVRAGRKCSSPRRRRVTHFLFVVGERRERKARGAAAATAARTAVPEPRGPGPPPRRASCSPPAPCPR